MKLTRDNRGRVMDSAGCHCRGWDSGRRAGRAREADSSGCERIQPSGIERPDQLDFGQHSKKLPASLNEEQKQASRDPLTAALEYTAMCGIQSSPLV